MTDNVRVAVPEQRAMHLQDGVCANGCGRGKSRLHRSDISDDELRISGGMLTGFCQCDLTCAAGEVFNL